MDPDAVAAPLPRESPPRDDDSPDAGDKDGRKRRHKEKRSHKHKSKEKKRSREKSPALPEGPSVGDGEDDGEEGELLPHASPLPSPSPLRYVRAMPLAACVRSWVYHKVCNSGSLHSPSPISTPGPPRSPAREVCHRTCIAMQKARAPPCTRGLHWETGEVAERRDEPLGNMAGISSTGSCSVSLSLNR